jgi:hypothetical protein
VRLWNCLVGAASLAIALTGHSPAALAKPATLDIVPQKQLRFGSFGVMASGSRTVSPSGAVTSVGIIPVQGSATGPAEFTITYDRGNENRRPVSLVIEVVLHAAPPLNLGGMVATVSDYTTDLANAPTLAPGQVVALTIDNCNTRLCSRSFRVGGRLQVQRSSGGGPISIPLPITATVILVDGRRP